MTDKKATWDVKETIRPQGERLGVCRRDRLKLKIGEQLQNYSISMKGTGKGDYCTAIVMMAAFAGGSNIGDRKQQNWD